MRIGNLSIRTGSMLAVIMAVCSICATSGSGKDKVISTKTTEGYYVRWEMGDYNHAVFKNSKGKEFSYFADPKIKGALESLKGKLLKITYEVRESYIPEAGGNMKIEVLKSVEYDRKVYYAGT